MTKSTSESRDRSLEAGTSGQQAKPPSSPSSQETRNQRGYMSFFSSINNSNPETKERRKWILIIACLALLLLAILLALLLLLLRPKCEPVYEFTEMPKVVRCESSGVRVDFQGWFVLQSTNVCANSRSLIIPLQLNSVARSKDVGLSLKEAKLEFGCAQLTYYEIGDRKNWKVTLKNSYAGVTTCYIEDMSRLVGDFSCSNKWTGENIGYLKVKESSSINFDAQFSNELCTTEAKFLTNQQQESNGTMNWH